MARPYDADGEWLQDADDESDLVGRPPANPTAPGDEVAFDPSRVPPGIPLDWARDFIRRNPGDYERMGSAYGAPVGAAPGGDSSFWNPPPDRLSFGVPPSPFGETYATLPRPAWLQGEYVPPTWSEQFVAPTAADLYTDPGYQARLDASQRSHERSAAAKGSLLSGGFIGRTLPRAQQELASQEYGAAVGRAFDTYRQRYGEFADAAARGFGARGLNEAAYGTDVANQANQFNTRYTAHQQALENKRRAEEDLWRRQMDASRLGLDAKIAGAPR
jgi:hypothetical protein